ncbi:hypothetical protein NDI56_13165 [Haloarcula sp. S1CR25-12]|uniref:Uncharacterized protein n=1 Tax=Haloarcula saliterrae TaxID=2950534 RepID=A0ABU2FDQ4_9EURY|nr:hypothetical protein [Haloarcula sp. S1CR25-12]MDS0260347.1 hypothetical protein [Haloarcula sp. S1CR25-12]
MRLSDTERRLVWLASGLAGLVHLLVPGLLLRLARVAYRWGLAVEFDPKSGAKRRVRLVGVGFLLFAAVLRRLLQR